jgi:hypothetical protein
MVRTLSLTVCAALALLAAGCAPGKSDIEKSVREEMKTQLGLEITAIDLTKKDDGSYAGTATAANGDVYDIVTGKPSGNKIEWKAYPSQSVIEKTVRSELESQMKTKVKSLALASKGEHVYEGKAELENGMKMKVSTHMDGTQLKWEAVPSFE